MKDQDQKPRQFTEEELRIVKEHAPVVTARYMAKRKKMFVLKALGALALITVGVVIRG